MSTMNRQSINELNLESKNIFRDCLIINQVTDENLEDLDGIVDIAAHIGAKIIRFRYVKGLTEDAIKMGVKEKNLPLLKKKLQTIKDVCKKKGIICTLYRSTYVNCTAPFFFPFIDFKGNLLPCCTMGVPAFDNVLERGFRKAWNGNKMRRWRGLIITKRNPKKCKELCGLPSYLYGAFKME